MLPIALLLIWSSLGVGFDLFKREATPHLVPRATSDSCCKSCGPIGQALVECPLNTTDIFCVCDQWVKSAPTCQTCISNVNFNTSYAATPGPLLEIFWAFCQCQTCCREVAEAVFAPEPCKSGTDNVCVSEILVNDGPKCEKCLHHTDEWFASYFGIFIEQGKEFLETEISAVPGTSSWSLINGRNLFVNCLRWATWGSFTENTILTSIIGVI